MIEATGLAGIAYGILDKDPDIALMGGSVALSVLLTEIGLLPARRIIRGRIISQTKSGMPYKI